jgi:hypothetical protein
VYAKPSHFHRDVTVSLRNSIESQLYQRPASLRLESSFERHRASRYFPPTMDGYCSSNYCSVVRQEHPYDDVIGKMSPTFELRLETSVSQSLLFPMMFMSNRRYICTLFFLDERC